MQNPILLDFEYTGFYSKIFLDYLQQKNELAPFYNRFPDKAGFAELLAQRKFSDENRNVLSETLINQYKNIPDNSQIIKQIRLLKHPHTYTVCTGHQLCIFLGPLYVIYKIVTTINLARTLKQWFPEKNFVPIFWMATEDHDVAEINHLYLFQKKIEWPTNQSGAVGRFNLYDFDQVFAQYTQRIPKVEEAYKQGTTLAEATRFLIHQLFGAYGLVCLDADEKSLKKIFSPHIQSDVLYQNPFRVTRTSNEGLTALGYGNPLYIREINHFYMEGNLRTRIEKTESAFVVQHSEKKLTASDLQHEISNFPEKFSPNAALRPLYQEMLLPNVAYVGGPAEIAYWLQLKPIFDAEKIDFPALVPRNAALHVTASQLDKLSKLGIQVTDLFKPESLLKEQYLRTRGLKIPDLESDFLQLGQIFAKIKSQVTGFEPTLSGYIESEQREFEKIIQRIEKKLKKAAEIKEQNQIHQLLHLRNKLFPEQNLQERRDNFLNIYFNNPDFIETLLHIFDPLNFKFIIYSLH